MCLSTCLDFFKTQNQASLIISVLPIYTEIISQVCQLFNFSRFKISVKKVIIKDSLRMMRRQNQDQQSRVLDELSALVFNLLRSPSTPISFSDQFPVPSTSVRRRLPEITPGGFASLLLGISLTLMLCGSVTFFIGFLLMPWVLGLVMVFYVAGIVSTISMLGRSILCYATAPPSPPRKEIPAWKIL